MRKILAPLACATLLGLGACVPAPPLTLKPLTGTVPTGGNTSLIQAINARGIGVVLGDLSTSEAMAQGTGTADGTARAQCLGEVIRPLSIMQQQAALPGIAQQAELAIELDQAMHSAPCLTLAGQLAAVKQDVAGFIAGQLGPVGGAALGVSTLAPLAAGLP